MSKAGHMYEASKGRAREADEHKLSSVRTAHNERDAARESTSGNHDAIRTQCELSAPHV